MNAHESLIDDRSRWRREYDAMRKNADAVALDALLDNFQRYLADGTVWSNADMQTYRRLFSRYGIAGRTADDLVHEAQEALGNA